MTTLLQTRIATLMVRAIEEWEKFLLNYTGAIKDPDQLYLATMRAEFAFTALVVSCIESTHEQPRPNDAIEESDRIRDTQGLFTYTWSDIKTLIPALTILGDFDDNDYSFKALRRLYYHIMVSCITTPTTPTTNPT